MTMDMPSRSDSSRTSAIPATSLLSRIASILETNVDLTTSYGNSVISIFCLPPFSVEIAVLARTTILPRPVL